MPAVLMVTATTRKAFISTVGIHCEMISLICVALCLSCASQAPLPPRVRPDVLAVPPVAAYVLPGGLEDYAPVPLVKGAPAPADGVLVSEADATRDLLARSELDSRRVEGRALRDVLAAERTWSVAAISASRDRALRAELTASRWRRWGPWAIGAGVLVGAFAASR